MLADCSRAHKSRAVQYSGHSVHAADCFSNKQKDWAKQGTGSAVTVPPP